jgi:antibiotic biosynthesis monooxygenase (ABM) superfamily enzyme
MATMQEKIQQLLAPKVWKRSDEAEQVAFDQWLDSPEGRAWLENEEPTAYETTAACWE